MRLHISLQSLHVPSDFVVWHCATLRHLANPLRANVFEDATKTHLLQIFNCRVSCRGAGTDMKNDRQ